MGRKDNVVSHKMPEYKIKFAIESDYIYDSHWLDVMGVISIFLEDSEGTRSGGIFANGDCIGSFIIQLNEAVSALCNEDSDYLLHTYIVGLQDDGHVLKLQHFGIHNNEQKINLYINYFAIGDEGREYIRKNFEPIKFHSRDSSYTSGELILKLSQFTEEVFRITDYVLEHMDRQNSSKEMSRLIKEKREKAQKDFESSNS